MRDPSTLWPVILWKKDPDQFRIYNEESFYILTTYRTTGLQFTRGIRNH
jgi:hypothetical protein